MSKELTPLEAFYDLLSPIGLKEAGLKRYNLIETALKEKANIENRLDEIFENHNIKSFTELNERLCDYNELKFDDDIKQKKLKALEIIKEKGLPVQFIKEIMLIFQIHMVEIFF